jgi:hypothetical protein
VSNAQHYKSNLRDIFFNLFEVLRIDEKISTASAPRRRSSASWHRPR